MTFPQLHELKTLPLYFEAVASGAKTAEIRRDDRGFKVGDILWLREWDPATGYTGREARARITHVTSDPAYFAPGHVMLSMGAVDAWVATGAVGEGRGGR
jgi:hypothetical protein